MERRTQLVERLERFRPADPAEREHLGAIRQLLLSPRDPFDRSRFRPGHVTASSFALSPDRCRVLLVHHAELNRWLQPGGHVEPGDSCAAAAAARELLEETGIAVEGPVDDAEPFDVDVHPIPANPHAPAHHHFDVRFLWIVSETATRGSAESVEVAWVPLDELLRRNDSPSMRRVRSKLQ